MGFRRTGTAWDGQRFEVVPSLWQLLLEVEARILNRPTASDGTVASRRHDEVSPNSDHTPKPKDAPKGWVRAGDITVTQEQGDMLTEFLRQSRDPRIKYVIWDRQMFSSYSNSRRNAWEWGAYGGSNGHTTHVHISVNADNQNDDSPWGLGDIEGGADMAAMQVEDIQQALNDAGRTDHENKPLAVDGEYGPRTHSALVKGFQFVDVGNAIGTDQKVEALEKELADLKEHLRGV